MKLQSVFKTKYQDTLVYSNFTRPKTYTYQYVVTIDYEGLDTLYYYFDRDEQATSFANLVVQIFTREKMDPRGVTDYINQLYVMVVEKHETKAMG